MRGLMKLNEGQQITTHAEKALIADLVCLESDYLIHRTRPEHECTRLGKDAM